MAGHFHFAVRSGTPARTALAFRDLSPHTGHRGLRKRVSEGGLPALRLRSRGGASTRFAQNASYWLKALNAVVLKPPKGARDETSSSLAACEPLAGRYLCACRRAWVPGSRRQHPLPGARQRWRGTFRSPTWCAYNCKGVEEHIWRRFVIAPRSWPFPSRSWAIWILSILRFTPCSAVGAPTSDPKAARFR